MKIEYEATFTHIDKGAIRKILQKVGAECLRPKFMQRRFVFNLPSNHKIKGGWLRVRDEGNRITMSLKVVDGDTIKDQKEICLTVDDFDEAAQFLAGLGARKKSYQETKRELWKLGHAEITIDEWPFLEPLLEIEADSETIVRVTAEKLGLNYANARFCSVSPLYAEKYGVSEDRINNQTPKIVFKMENPFLDNKKTMRDKRIGKNDISDETE